MTRIAVTLLTALVVLVPGGSGHAATVDRTAPTTTWTTKDRALLVSPLHRFEGVSEDAGSGVARVFVRMSGPWVCVPPGADRTCYTIGNPWAWRTVEATRSCTTGAKRCRWSAPLPPLPGEYIVQAYAIDVSGNDELACYWFFVFFCVAPTIRVIVV